MRKKNHTFRHATGLILAAMLWASGWVAQAQIPAKTITIREKAIGIEKAFAEVKAQSGIFIMYENAIIDKNLKISLDLQNATLQQAMNEICGKAGLAFEILDKHVLVTKAATYRDASQPNGKSNATQTYEGTVTDETGEPLVGAVVHVKNESLAVTTDINGKFNIKTTPGSSLVISYLGYEAGEITTDDHTILNITLRQRLISLSEVVVSTGYQTISREKSTGAITTISSEKLADRYTLNLMDNLEGRVAGLTVYDGKMTIRGAGSLYAETSPLLVVDGLPIEGSIDDINPYDVESVTVLKDASATAIYGARATNGIIVITTKKAQVKGRISIDASANFTVYQKRNLDYAANGYMTPEQQIKTEQDYYQYYFFDNNGEVADPIGSTENAIAGYSLISPVQYAYYQLAKGLITQADFDRQIESFKKNNFAKEYAENALQNRFLQQYNLAVRTRSENFASNLIINYRGDNAGIKEADNNQMNIFYKGMYDMAKWLTVNFSVNSIISRSTGSNSEFATNPFNVPSYTRLLNDDGSYAQYAYYCHYNALTEVHPELRSMRFNHLQELSYDQKHTNRQNTRYHGELLFKAMEGLTLNTQFVYETDRLTENAYAEADSYIMRMMWNAYTIQQGTAPNYTYRHLIPENGGKLATVNTQGDYWTARGQANFNRNFGKHAVNIISGLEFRQTKTNGIRSLLLGYDDQLQSDATTTISMLELSNYTYSTFFATNFPARQLLYTPWIASAIGPVVEQLHRYASGYVNATYTFDNRFNLFGSFRKDYADLYGLNAKFRGKPLWSVGGNWNIHNEAFMRHNGPSFVDFLQLRMSYGVTGNIYQGATSLMTANASGINQTTKQPVSTIESPANPELKWEETATTNVGLDFRLFNHRLRGGIDYYHKKGTDIFANKTLDPSKGFASLAMNLAGLKNDGVELTLAYDWIRAARPDDFAWSTSLTASYNKNEITYVELQATRAYELISQRFREGYPVNALFSYQFAGIDNEGEPTWWGSDGQALRSAQTTGIEAIVFSGQSDPKTVLGMENVWKYKGFSLNVLMAYYGGHKMRVLQASPTFTVPVTVVPSYFLNAWTPDNTDTNVPGIGRYAASSIGSESTYTDIYVQPADFLKIRNCVVGYELPQRLLSGIGLKHAALRFQIDNPKYLWVKNKVGVDPETLSMVRTPTSYIFGLNLNF
ncbi:MAG: SusC/RagA family TonB-linked outer membrane protein [Dysgonamonadaceae bacterium]|nr:SusC/RagA family TonB-linked outer membrane protein [Dysgonamonadaceae bacterium]